MDKFKVNEREVKLLRDIEEVFELKYLIIEFIWIMESKYYRCFWM